MTLFVWDFHGVLEEGNEVSVLKICKKVLKHFGFSQRVNLRKVEQLYGLSWKTYYRNIVPNQPEKTYNSMVSMSIECSDKIVRKHMVQAKNAAKVLAKLVALGHKNIVLSNTDQASIELFVKWVGLTKYFYKICGIDGDSNTPKKSKLDCIREYINELKPSKVVTISDLERDNLYGKKLGAITVFVRRNHNKNVKTTADYDITDLSQILEIS